MTRLLISLLSEDGTAESVSTMRMATLLVVVLALLPRVIETAHTGQAPALSAEDVGLVLGVLGVKAWQRGRENTPPPAPPVPDPTP